MPMLPRALKWPELTLGALVWMAGVLGQPVLAQPAQAAPYPQTLAACRASAEKAAPAVTSFACDWRALIKGAHGAALSGPYTGRSRFYVSSLTIIEGGGPSLVGIEATVKSNGRQCLFKGSGTRDANDVLVVRDPDAPGCTVRIISSGGNRVRVSADKCQDSCGMGATFEGEYRLRP